MSYCNRFSSIYCLVDLYSKVGLRKTMLFVAFESFKNPNSKVSLDTGYSLVSRTFNHKIRLDHSVDNEAKNDLIFDYLEKCSSISQNGVRCLNQF